MLPRWTCRKNPRPRESAVELFPGSRRLVRRDKTLTTDTTWSSRAQHGATPKRLCLADRVFLQFDTQLLVQVALVDVQILLNRSVSRARRVEIECDPAVVAALA